MNQDQLNVVISLAVALLGGLAVGIEREWSSRAPGEHKRFAGVRTFALIGLIGALGVELIQFGQPAAGIAALACGVALIATSYFGSVSRGHRESTTEFAAIIVLAAGALAGTGRLELAAGINVLTAFLLVEKSRIHTLVFRIQSEELRAGVRFAV
ncbi:MAG TPA: MgtC/SapB family protein, partial [Acidobacteriota bacterium]|nr:MgtC/SapB family protein [Acidobacteriota bacterium]